MDQDTLQVEDLTITSNGPNKYSMNQDTLQVAHIFWSMVILQMGSDYNRSSIGRFNIRLMSRRSFRLIN
jgi:hypothetical protein